MLRSLAAPDSIPEKLLRWHQEGGDDILELHIHKSLCWKTHTRSRNLAGHHVHIIRPPVETSTITSSRSSPLPLYTPIPAPQLVPITNSLVPPQHLTQAPVPPQQPPLLCSVPRAISQSYESPFEARNIISASPFLGAHVRIMKIHIKQALWRFRHLRSGRQLV